jgi:serine/threonine protein kinase
MAVYDTQIKLEIPEKLFFHPGDQLDLNGQHYQIEKKIGEGGFGSVYLVKSQKQNYLAAIKILNLYKIAPNEYSYFRDKFKQEYFVGKVKHPNLLHYFGIGLLHGNPYVLMEYCPNGSLQEAISTPKSDADILRIAYEIANGLSALHDRNIIHRDIKPENVLLGEENIYKITDFGISAVLDQRLTRASFLGNVENSEVFGSIMYSAPEQLNKKTYYKGTKPTMDIYSYGVLLYNLLFQGADPFGGEDLYQKNPEKYLQQKKQFTTKGKITHSPAQEILLEIIDKCLQNKPEHRFQSMAELIHVLDHVSLAKTCSKHVPYLRIQKQDDNPMEYNLINLHSLSTDNILIGRNKEPYNHNHINLAQSATISKYHATISKENGKWFVKDGQCIHVNGKPEWKASLNGTRLNGRYLTAEQKMELQEGDQIQVADFIISFTNHRI